MGASAGGFAPIDPSADSKYLRQAPQVAPADALAVKDAFAAPAQGPRGVFLVGFGAGAEAVESWFRSMDPGTPVRKLGFPLGWDAAERPLLREVLEAGGGSEGGTEPAPAGELPVVLLSGMSGEEAVAIIQSWTEFTGAGDEGAAGDGGSLCLHRSRRNRTISPETSETAPAC